MACTLARTKASVGCPGTKVERPLFFGAALQRPVCRAPKNRQAWSRRFVTESCLGPWNNPNLVRLTYLLPAIANARANDAATDDSSAQNNSNIESVQPEEKRSGPLVMPPKPILGVMPLEHAENQRSLTEQSLVNSDAIFNVELAWLGFNWRVFAMALDKRTPLIERLRFCAITESNLDEFFEKRVGGLKTQQLAGAENLKSKESYIEGSMWTPTQQLKLIAPAVRDMRACVDETLMEDILPELKAKTGISIVQSLDELDEHDKQELEDFFMEEVEPLITPLAIDPGHPFPSVTNLQISLAVELQDPFVQDIASGASATLSMKEKRSADFITLKRFSIVILPSTISRWIPLHGKNGVFAPLELVLRLNLDRIYGGMMVLSVHPFRITRSADISRHEEDADDLLEMITLEVRHRKFASVTRLEVDANMPDHVVKSLVYKMELAEDDVYHIRGLIGLNQLFKLPVNCIHNHRDFEWPKFKGFTHSRLVNIGQPAQIFKRIRQGDILVHHPFHSFRTSTQLFVEMAAADPTVMAIKATLYRTNDDSPIIGALARAAESGKQVAVLVELKARFDEARNVGFAHMLEKAGCNVAYGLVGLKTHCKVVMVVRQEPEGLRKYVHIGTGNYNPSTAGVYTDFGLLTCDEEIGDDALDLFKYLTGYHRQKTYRKLLVAPRFMHKAFSRLVSNEIKNAKAGLPSGMVIKCNALTDKHLTDRLYEASKAGVKIDMIIRGPCRIRPGLPGFSDNIRVVSIIGRFLEHHRLYRFENGGDPKYFIGSADWMTRNLERRVEVVTPITDSNLKAELQAILDICLGDRFQAWNMRVDGRYSIQRGLPEAEAGIGTHAELIKLADQEDKAQQKLRRMKVSGGLPRKMASIIQPDSVL